MAAFTNPGSDSDSDFGYDFSPDEERLLLQLASNNHAPSIKATSVTEDDRTSVIIDAVPGKTDSVAELEDDASSLDSRWAPGPSGRIVQDTASGALPSPVSISDDVVYPNLSHALSNLEPEKPQLEIPSAIEDESFDDRSPLQRFRSYPKKPLSVTDLTSGAWCELQYWYTLTRLPGGRRTRTKAMRQGSKVHQKLEDEVHTTVKIDIMTKEDGFGLRLWNLVQGLRTLRDTGLTRELEVWGMVDGNLVNGVIDGVSYENPNPEFEEELSSQESQSDGKQSKLAEYFPSKKLDKASRSAPKIYLTDVKTRGSLAPVSGRQLRPAKIQLLLYQRFLSDIATGELDFLKVFRRYGLDADDPFSDTFIAQVGALHDEIFVDAPSSTDESRPKRVNKKATARRQNDESTAAAETDSETPGPDLLKYRCLRELLSLVQDEVKLTFPLGADSLGHMLRVQYVHRDDGRELDLHDFPVSRQALDAYLSKYMAWWRGEREATGVEIEDAIKCGTCEFAADCSWRQGMDEERVKKAQEKMSARRAAGT